MKLKITTVGNSAGVILPKDLLARLRLEKGDELHALETPDGIRLTVYDPTLAEQMEVAEQVMAPVLAHRSMVSGYVSPMPTMPPTFCSLPVTESALRQSATSRWRVLSASGQ